MPSLNRLPLVLRLLRLLSLASDTIGSAARRLLYFWILGKGRFWKLHGNITKSGRSHSHSTSKGSGRVVDRAGGDSAVFYSKEPIATDFGYHLENNSGRFLSPASTPGPSRPLSGVSQDSVDSRQYTISVQNASQPSLISTAPSDFEQRDIAAAEEHLRPLSRTSSARSSYRRDRGFSRAVAGATTNRAISRSRSRARSPAAPLHPYAHASRSSVAVQFVDVPEEKASTHSVPNRAVPAGTTPFPEHSVQPRRTQKVYPILSIHRYERNMFLKDTESVFTVKPMEMPYQFEEVPPGWIAITHPEGALYFYHAERRIYTDAYLCDKETFEEIEDFAAQLDGMVKGAGYTLPPNVDLVLELEENMKPDKETLHHWCYYYADHDARVLFWIQEYTVTDDLAQLLGINSGTHLKHGIEEQYWYRHLLLHWDMFPHDHSPTKEVVNELAGIIVHATTDQLTSTTSTITYSTDELGKMLTLVKSVKDIADGQHKACVVGRLMHIFAHQRFLHYHGQRVARLCRDQSLFGSAHSHRTPLITFLAPILFNAPEVHLRSLEKIWIDQIITVIPWSHFMSKLQEDWQEYVLFATVLLNANISFMTITDVDPGSGPRTPAQIASFVSTTASIGSTLVGLLLIRQYRLKPKDTAQDAANYLLSRRHETLGLESLAIVYSLPYALLMWGMVTFLVAFAFECFQRPDSIARIISAVSWGLVCALIVWCIYIAWEGGEMSVRGWLGTAYAHVLAKKKAFSEGLHWPKMFRQPPLDTPSTPDTPLSEC